MQTILLEYLKSVQDTADNILRRKLAVVIWHVTLGAGGAVLRGFVDEVGAKFLKRLIVPYISQRCLKNIAQNRLVLQVATAGDHIAIGSNGQTRPGIRTQTLSALLALPVLSMFLRHIPQEAGRIVEGLTQKLKAAVGWKHRS